MLEHVLVLLVVLVAAVYLARRARAWASPRPTEPCGCASRQRCPAASGLAAAIRDAASAPRR